MLPLALSRSCPHCWGHHHPFLQKTSPHPLYKEYSKHSHTTTFESTTNLSARRNHVRKPVHRLQYITETIKVQKVIHKIETKTWSLTYWKVLAYRNIYLHFHMYYVPYLICKTQKKIIKFCKTKKKKYHIAVSIFSYPNRTAALRKDDLPSST